VLIGASRCAARMGEGHPADIRQTPTVAWVHVVVTVARAMTSTRNRLHTGTMNLRRWTLSVLQPDRLAPRVQDCRACWECELSEDRSPVAWHSVTHGDWAGGHGDVQEALLVLGYVRGSEASLFGLFGNF